MAVNMDPPKCSCCPRSTFKSEAFWWVGELLGDTEVICFAASVSAPGPFLSNPPCFGYPGEKGWIAELNLATYHNPI